MPEQARNLRQLAELASWTLGIAGLMWWAMFQIDVARAAEQDLARFAMLKALATNEVPDQSLWSSKRVLAWRGVSSESFPPPLAVLSIPRLRLSVAVLPGTDDRTLDRGVGHIAETALPNTRGNAGIAGHRDSFFRGLGDLVPGDTIELATFDRAEIYRVERTWIVNPEDVSVLDPTPSPAITLVTCYPFYFVGSAPQRFIVRAVRTGLHPPS
jgi:sortase A